MMLHKLDCKMRAPFHRSSRHNGRVIGLDLAHRALAASRGSLGRAGTAGQTAQHKRHEAALPFRRVSLSLVCRPTRLRTLTNTWSQALVVVASVHRDVCNHKEDPCTPPFECLIYAGPAHWGGKWDWLPRAQSRGGRGGRHFYLDFFSSK